MMPREFLFQKGNNFNPGGRPRGSRNRFAAQFIKDFLKEWEQSGPDALRILAKEEPAKFVAIAAAIIPRDFTLEIETVAAELSDEQLEQMIAKLRSELDPPMKLIEAKVSDAN
jgi:hypothetical protein